eukprot:maker-scaffold76_size406464-snap-gene-3.15 protein:Tk10245 transcript:maker-scaffold76_size406464-snap-gene-3.15-mRNA-1 annotation:"hypothetical protein DAPPUDRAFT_237790"
MALERGLTVVDVYSEWSGPCSAMTNFLKKMKLEVNDDMLTYAMAKADTIPQLEVLRGHCKPIWLFMASGHPVSVVHGANAPLLGRMILQEVARERKVLAGDTERQVIALDEAVPRKSLSDLTQNNMDDPGPLDDSMYQCLKDIKMSQESKSEPNKNFALLLIEEYIKDMGPEALADIIKVFEDKEMSVMRQKDAVLGQDDVLTFSSGSNVPQQQISPMIGTNCRMLLLICQDETVNAQKRINAALGPKDGSKQEKRKGLQCFMFDMVDSEKVLQEINRKKVPTKSHVEIKLEDPQKLLEVMAEVEKTSEAKHVHEAASLQELLEDHENLKPDQSFLIVLVDKQETKDKLKILAKAQPLAVSNHPKLIGFFFKNTFGPNAMDESAPKKE